MKKILLRSGKSQFEAVDVETTLKNNLLGTNSGNLVFAHVAQKTLSVAGCQVVPYRYTPSIKDASRVNEEMDVFVIPLANAFRPSFLPHLRKITEFVKKLRIPVVVLGVGAQADLNYDTSELAAIDADVREFVSAILERSASIGVRGECTYEYLRKLGFSSVDIIGCPSMFLRGGNLPLRERNASLAKDAKVAINISPYVQKMGDIVMRNLTVYGNLCYIPQNNIDLQLMLWGETFENYCQYSKIPKHLSHPVFRENKARFFVDPGTWIEFLADYDFSFGTRIHGNIVAILAGTPCHVLAHDSRTMELVRYFEIPHTRIDALPEKPILAGELYEMSDYTRMQLGHKGRFEAYSTFLKKNNLPNIFLDENRADLEAYEAREKTLALPGPVIASETSDVKTLALRMQWMHRDLDRRMRRLEKA
jgi:hypothetical protein